MQDGGVGLLKAFKEYIKEEGQFSRVEMMKDEHREMCKSKNKPVDLVFIWSFIESQPLSSDTPNRLNTLVKLAIQVLTLIANSAGFAATLIHNSFADNIEPDLPPIIPAAELAPSGRSGKISLARLFKYNDGNGLDFYWEGGIQNIKWELQ
ncbi:hypothetical protein H0H81_011291 [Sphagnurus paluster]|uniref:Uncharacterized protein n=1 Tax=Sphagnurus paluster TaxID=117069 RepID=A0A9P7GNU1_9AGAR|nr:hypothetical protein H0H81_011291 [Sphagnurus paluster]